MARRGDGEPDESPQGGEERPQDEFVERLRPDPSQPPQRVLTLAGLLGDSDRTGFRRLYFTRELDYYAEFRAEDVLDTASIPREEPPFLGDEATRVTLKRDATVEYTRTRAARPLDEFDLDVRLGGGWAQPRAAPQTFAATCWNTCPAGCIGTMTCGCPTERPCLTWVETCAGRTCVGRTCDTCVTCDTCQTVCGQPTCETCQTCPGQATCQTCPGQATCQTCPGQATCVTCQTCPAQATCQTCQTCPESTCLDTCNICHTDICNTHPFTCRCP
jgi:hypothetical protein